MFNMPVIYWTIINRYNVMLTYFSYKMYSKSYWKFSGLKKIINTMSCRLWNRDYDIRYSRLYWWRFEKKIWSAWIGFVCKKESEWSIMVPYSWLHCSIHSRRWPYELQLSNMQKEVLFIMQMRISQRYDMQRIQNKQ